MDKFERRTALPAVLETAVAPFSTHPTFAARRKALQRAVAAGLP